MINKFIIIFHNKTAKMKPRKELLSEGSLIVKFSIIIGYKNIIFTIQQPFFGHKRLFYLRTNIFLSVRLLFFYVFLSIEVYIIILGRK